MRHAVGLVALALLGAGATPAAAHVDVLPTTVVAGEAQQFVVRVPTERELATTAVRIEIPAAITVFSVAEPPPGWTVRATRGGDGRFSRVVYRGGRIGVNRYLDFRMLGTGFTPGEAEWRAFQTYADGKVKPWTGPQEDEGAPESGPTDPGPAARVTVLPEGSSPGTGPPAPAAEADDESGAGIWLGVIAIAISGLSLLALGFLWSTRPARLPEDP